MHPRIAESSRERPPDATRASRDDCDLPLEHAHAAESTFHHVGVGAVPQRYRGLGVGTVALMVAGATFTLLAALSLWSWRTFASSEGFADVSTDMLKEPAVAEILAEHIVTALEAQPDVARVGAAARPALVELVKDVIQTPPFQSLFHAAVLELHASIVAGHRQSLGLHLDGAPQLFKTSLRVVNPGLAASIPDSALTTATKLSRNRGADLVMRASDLAGWLVIPFAVIATVCFALSVRISPHRRRTVEVIGLSMLIIGVSIFIVLGAVLQVVADVGTNPVQRTALRAVFWSLMHVLNVTAKLLMIVGASLALAAAIAGSGTFEERMRGIAQAGRIVLARPGTKALAALSAVAAGLFGLIWPLATAQLITRVAAVGLLTTGAVWIFDLAGAAAWANGHDSVHPMSRRVFISMLTAAAVAPLFLIVGGMTFVRALRPPAYARINADPNSCNGSPLLCDRRLDEVAFAATHNSMADEAEHFTGAHQKFGMLAQLAGGVRAFLIDLHYGGTITGQLVHTDVAAEAELSDAYDDISAQARAELTGQLRGLGLAPPHHSVYLCHVYCEAGALKAQKAFEAFNRWLRENPNQIVILVLEDHVSAKDAVDVIEKSGLATRAYVWVRGSPPPTLRELIELHDNVVIMAENHGGTVPDAPWYLSAYTNILQDTPYDFASPDDLDAVASCAPNRGPADAPLFLVNHWVDTGYPDPGVAKTANSDLLRDRLARCAERRRRMPNLIAVDFYSQGDLMQIVDDLNGVGPDNGDEIAAAS